MVGGTALTSGSIPNASPDVWNGDIETVIALRDAGFSMVPSRGPEKSPCVPWKKFQDNRPLVETIRRWAGEFQPERWGPVTGTVSGVVVADFDGTAGAQLMERWRIQTPHVRTPSGGSHWYLKHPGWKVPTLNSKASKKAWPWTGLDIRGDGGFAVLLGKTATGAYEWLRDPREADSWESLPEEVRNFLQQYSQQERGTVAPREHQVGKRVDAAVLVGRALERAPADGRNNVGMWLACQLRDNRYSIAEAETAMQYYRSGVGNRNSKGKSERYTEAEMLATLREAFGRPAREPWAENRADVPGPRLVTKDGSARDGDGPPPPDGPSDLPTIKVAPRQLGEVSAETLAALLAGNSPPRLFLHGDQIVEIAHNDRGQTVIRELGSAGLRRHLTRVAYFKDHKYQPCFPPLEIVQHIGSMPADQLKFPSLVGVTDFPILRPDGSIHAAPGYDPATQMVYSPRCEFQIPEDITSDHIDVGRSLLDEMLSDFPFVDDASAANARAAIITAIIRPAITGPVPVALIDAPQAGTGKSKLAEIVALLATGAPAEMYAPPATEEEFAKILTTILVGGNQVAVIDNVARRFDSPNFAKAVTETLHADRQFRTHTKIVLPVVCTWIVTGNNLRIGGDLPRRCFWIRLDARVSRPFLRTGFLHPDLVGWVKENRARLVTAILTMARAWFLAGRPAVPQLTPLGSFEDWSLTVGGVLRTAGVNGFLGNIDQLHRETDAEGTQWESFLLAIDELFYGEPFTVSSVWERLHAKGGWDDRALLPSAVDLRAVLPDFLAEALGRGDGFFQRRCGKCFAEFVGRRFGESGVYLCRAGMNQKSKVQLWKVGRDADAL